MTVRVTAARVAAAPHLLDTLRATPYDGRAVAVTVPDETPYLVLDADDRIVKVGPAAEAVYGSLMGRTLWDRFPEAEALFKPHYDRARRAREEIELVQFFRGQVGWLRLAPSGSDVTVSWRMLFALDTLTLDRLRDSIAEALELIDSWEAKSHRERLRTSLRVLEGGSEEGDAERW